MGTLPVCHKRCYRSGAHFQQALRLPTPYELPSFSRIVPPPFSGRLLQCKNRGVLGRFWQVLWTKAVKGQIHDYRQSPGNQKEADPRQVVVLIEGHYGLASEVVRLKLRQALSSMQSD